MPNWCLTNINITHPDIGKVKELYDKLQEWTAKNAAENGFGHSWLGNIVLASGIGTVDTGNPTDFRCRGCVICLDISEDVITVSTETAWCPMLRMWQALVDRYLPDAEIIFTAEEPGFEVYVSNDLTIIGNYVLDIYEDGLAGGGFEKEYHCVKQTELLKYLRWLFLENKTGRKLLAERRPDFDLNMFEAIDDAGQLRLLLEIMDAEAIEGLSIHLYEETAVSDYD